MHVCEMEERQGEGNREVRPGNGERRDDCSQMLQCVEEGEAERSPPD